LLPDLSTKAFQLLWIPNSFGDLGVKNLPLIKISAPKVFVRTKTKPALLDKRKEARIAFVALWVKCSREKVLTVVMLQLLLIWQSAVACIEAFGQ